MLSPNNFTVLHGSLFAETHVLFLQVCGEMCRQQAIIMVTGIYRGMHVTDNMYVWFHNAAVKTIQLLCHLLTYAVAQQFQFLLLILYVATYKMQSKKCEKKSFYISQHTKCEVIFPFYFALLC